MNNQFSLKAYFILTLIFSGGYFLGRYHRAIEDLIYVLIYLINPGFAPPGAV